MRYQKVNGVIMAIGQSEKKANKKVNTFFDDFKRFIKKLFSIFYSIDNAWHVVRGNRGRLLRGVAWRTDDAASEISMANLEIMVRKSYFFLKKMRVRGKKKLC